VTLFQATLVAGLVLAVPAAHGAEVKLGDLVVAQAWARATTPTAAAGAAYLTVRNTGAVPDRIVALEAPVAGQAMAHETRQDGDVVRMTAASPLTIPPGGTLTLQPGGTHVMLMDLKGGLKPGQEFPLTVTFEKAGTVTVPVKVGRPGALGPE
jgi:copper(I)-binding protein